VLDDGSAEIKDIYAYIDAVLERQANQPVYILTEEPEQITRTGGKANPNYLIFEEELLKHPLIKDKIQERINKRKFSTPISISKEQHKPTEKPEEKPTSDQISKAKEYDNIASIFPNGKVPSDLKEQWSKLNNRPNITQEEYSQLKAKAEQAGQQKPTEQVPPKPESEIVKENSAL